MEIDKNTGDVKIHWKLSKQGVSNKGFLFFSALLLSGFIWDGINSRLQTGGLIFALAFLAIVVLFIDFSPRRELKIQLSDEKLVYKKSKFYPKKTISTKDISSISLEEGTHAEGGPENPLCLKIICHTGKEHVLFDFIDGDIRDELLAAENILSEFNARMGWMERSHNQLSLPL